MKCSMIRMTAVWILMVGIVAAVFLGCAAKTWHDQSESGVSNKYAAARSIGPTDRRGIALPAGSALARNEEIWVIERDATVQADTRRDDQTPGSGTLIVKPEADKPILSFPLKHTEVKANITGYIASVDVTQQYHNPFDTKIEAVYVFPLPHNAAVNEFVMTIGERKIRGIIREREEAEKIYAEAKRQGHVATLLTQERPNIFTQSVANIEPGKEIDINIRYFNTLSYSDGWFEFVFPMVVGPRFNPPGSTDGVGAVGRGDTGISGQKTEVQYLKPGERTGHDINVNIDLNAAVNIEKLECTSHLVDVKQTGEGRAQIALAKSDRIPNRDMVVRWQVAGRDVKSALLAGKDSRGGFFTMMLIPPATLENLPRQPLEMIFTLDTSGSMSGPPIEQSKAAMRYALRNMDGRDTFQIIRFSDRPDTFFRTPQPVTRENLEAGLRHIDAIQAGGGTMLVDGLRASLQSQNDEGRLRFVMFLTDGYIGNEAEALRETHNLLGSARIFSFGVGNAPNRYLMDHMAKMGGGASAYLPLSQPAEDVMKLFFERISHPAMIDVKLDQRQVTEVFPARIPDLFVGKPVIVTGRYTGELPATVVVKGKVNGQMREINVPVKKAEVPGNVLAPVWARNKLSDLADRSAWQQNEGLPVQIKTVALEFGLMSPYTAFIAVDSAQKTAGNFGVTVKQPVPVPDGVKYDTTVQEK